MARFDIFENKGGAGSWLSAGRSVRPLQLPEHPSCCSTVAQILSTVPWPEAESYI